MCAALATKYLYSFTSISTQQVFQLIKDNGDMVKGKKLAVSGLIQNEQGRTTEK